jgi:hypothetical protein
MVNEKLVYPQTERQRVLQALVFAESQQLSRELPRDTVLKSIQLRLSGSVVTTFASGTPVADARSTFDNLITRIDVTVGGSRVVKSVRPHMMRMQQLFATSLLGERRSSAAAAAATGNFPTVDAGFTYGTTTQTTTAAETIYVPFEMIYAEIGMGRESTWLNLKGAPSAELKLTTAAFAALLGFGNTAPVSYSASTFVIDIVTTEAQDVPASIFFSDWKQTLKNVQFSAETSDATIDLNKGNKLTGIQLFATDGAAGTATTASGKMASNLALTKLNLKVNGQTDIKSTTFLQLQSENRMRYGINAPMGSNVSLIDGVAHMNMLARKDLTTALDCRQPLVDSVQLILSTAPSGTVSYTNPVNVSIMTEELVVPQG